MRSPREIAFRLGQEAHNLRLWKFPPQPKLAGQPSPPDAIDDLRGSDFEREVLRLADQILAGRYPLFGATFNLGRSPDWRRDFVHGRASELKYFRLIRYLDFTAVGDHKVIWELNRHQWLVLLAMAWRFSGRAEYRECLGRHLTTWIDTNPFQEGINWCSALEVAFRALSWIWVWRLAEPAEARFLPALYQHGLHLERNLSFYFAPNTHLLGEAVALHALGAVFPGWPRARVWRELGGRVVGEQLDRQIERDGSHFEQSSYYHVYALDMFLLHRAMGGRVPDPRIGAMADYLQALMGPQREIPLVGDDDGGRLFHPYGECRRFGRATLATCAVLLDRSDWPYDAEDLHEQAAWWFGVRGLRGWSNPGRPVTSGVFRDAGMVVLARDDIHVLFDAGRLGRGSGGHSHADALSVIVRRGGEEILADAGTYTYVADPAERDRFRGTAAHNTVRVDGHDQATPAGPFRWDDKPEVELVYADDESAEAVLRTASYVHRRRIALRGAELNITDEIDGGKIIEQFWHPGGRPECIGVAGGVVETAWRSTIYGQKFEAQAIKVTMAGPRAKLAATIDLKEYETGLT